MLKVGLTGGIGSGKSAVAEAFARRGISVVDADRLSHALSAPGQPGLQALVEALGTGILDAQGHLDRPALRRRIFAEPTLRRQVETLLHPLVLGALEAELAATRAAYAVAVIPLLAESPASQALVDRILVVDSPEELQVSRLMSRDGDTSEEARAILAAQASRDARLAIADDILLNASDLAALDAAVERLHGFYRELAAQGDLGRSGLRLP
ncbi:MAG TPA: dephospho-CoA kinase [Gammaproteobacteria bacterium]|nr:dephospho-CoA kinase [Gammaproteobacteria bacterium]